MQGRTSDRLRQATQSILVDSRRTEINRGLQQADVVRVAEASRRGAPGGGTDLVPVQREPVAGVDDDDVEGFLVFHAGTEPGPFRAAPKAADCELLMSLASTQAPRLLQYLRLRDIVAFHTSSSSARSFCRSPISSKLIVPVLAYKLHWIPHVDLPSVEELYADNVVLISNIQNAEFASVLMGCTSLAKLYCTENTKMMAAKLAPALARLSHLTFLDISHNRLAIDDHAMFQREQPLEQLLASLPPRLRVIDLSHNLLQDCHAYQLAEGLEASAEIHGPCIEQLLLRSNYLGNGAGFAFGQLMKGPAGPRLWRLDLRTNRVESEGACALLQALHDHPRMRQLRIGYNKQNSKQDLHTARLASLLLQRALAEDAPNSLELLDLCNVRVGDDGMKSIARALSHNSTLRRLDLAFNSIGPEGVVALAAALENNHTLRELDLRDNEMGDEGALALATNLRSNFALRKLQLARNGIGTKGALALRAAVHSTSKLVVDFGASGDISNRQLQGMVNRSAGSMSNLRFTRDAEREHGVIQGSEVQTLMFAG